jgi:hypothetical protein
MVSISNPFEPSFWKPRGPVTALVIELTDGIAKLFFFTGARHIVD